MSGPKIERQAIEIAAASLALGALSRLSREDTAQILDKVAADLRSGKLRTDMIHEAAT